MPAQPYRKQGLRADAAHNRDRILEAARQAFTAGGIDVPLTAIARRAGVGVATLYRRFPTRAALVTEAFSEQLTACVSALDEALADPDPWHGFHTFIEKICAMQAADRGFTAAFLTRFPDAIDYDHLRARAENGLADLIQRAKAAGQLRPDFTESDVTLLLLANNAMVTESPEESLAASRRLLGYLLPSFRADRTEPLPPPAPLGLRRLHQ
ncbi:TetR/AcrR family transcriptional regulator [Nonomuraea sp. NN258]|uniref:TetR/AcrR family transcriptional regulator n=1 Tax=Nonomuraea antri TaxID=2730852 RepID=UPI00156A32C2|nr:TetR/AcrR family transcriptional regulator [Nonomuraea antri]NRQ36948.1 TetR/AcrR family transcriptional regulator [Nonomuraea antri]